MLLVALAAIVAGSLTALRFMVAIWQGSPEFSHGPIIPIVAAFLVWQQKDSFERQPFEGSWTGVVVCVFGALVALVGQLASLYQVTQYGALIAFYGLVLSLVGTKVFARLWMPLLLLFLVIPLPDFLQVKFSAGMQLISSRDRRLVPAPDRRQRVPRRQRHRPRRVPAAGGRGLRRPALPVPADDARASCLPTSTRARCGSAC